MIVGSPEIADPSSLAQFLHLRLRDHSLWEHFFFFWGNLEESEHKVLFCILFLWLRTMTQNNMRKRESGDMPWSQSIREQSRGRDKQIMTLEAKYLACFFYFPWKAKIALSNSWIGFCQSPESSESYKAVCIRSSYQRKLERQQFTESRNSKAILLFDSISEVIYHFFAFWNRPVSF